jgi:hypothetical protein
MYSKMSKKEYFDKYLKMIVLPDNAKLNGEAIWQKLELYHLLKYGVNRYKSYSSFKKEKSKFYKINR